MTVCVSNPESDGSNAAVSVSSCKESTVFILPVDVEKVIELTVKPPVNNQKNNRSESVDTVNVNGAIKE